jgi:hypothetical protein
VADVCSDNDVDIDRLLDLTWDGVRPRMQTGGRGKSRGKT